MQPVDEEQQRLQDQAFNQGVRWVPWNSCVQDGTVDSKLCKPVLLQVLSRTRRVSATSLPPTKRKSIQQLLHFCFQRGWLQPAHLELQLTNPFA